MLGTELLRALAEVTCEPGHDFHMDVDRLRDEVPHLHLLDHPFAQGSHDRLLWRMGRAGQRTHRPLTGVRADRKMPGSLSGSHSDERIAQQMTAAPPRWSFDLSLPTHRAAV